MWNAVHGVDGTGTSCGQRLYDEALIVQLVLQPGALHQRLNLQQTPHDTAAAAASDTPATTCSSNFQWQSHVAAARDQHSISTRRCKSCASVCHKVP
jgi:hypothetical protein